MSQTLTPVTYRDWNLPYGKLAKRPAYDEAEARRRFDAGQTLHVLFGDEVHPEQVLRVDLGGRLVKVVWLDELDRPELSYVFAQPEGCPDDELFLEQTRLASYDHDLRLPHGESSYDEAWYFKPDGSLYGVRGRRDSPSESTHGTLDAEQLLLHRERRPAFGEWDSLLRRER